MGMCMRNGCRRGAGHTIRIVVPEIGGDATAAEGMIPGLELCITHATKAKASDFFEANPELQNLLRMGVDPGVEPNFPEAYIEAVPLGAPDHLIHKAAADRKAH